MRHSIAAALGVAIWLASSSAQAALPCERGMVRAGCVGPHGAVIPPKPAFVVHPGEAGPVVAHRPWDPAPKHHCHYVKGRRVCY
jgi:hypothetical protein